MNRKIFVDFENGHHVCKPTKTHVKPGDTVEWASESKASVSFRGRTPFVEGEGPFPPGSFSTVRSVPPLKVDDEFVPDDVVGGIIIDKGD